LNVDFGVSGKGRLADQPFERYFLIGLGCDYDGILSGGWMTWACRPSTQSMGVNLH